ncbi:glycosyltransferase family 4 protein [Streptomyces zingiberis]|uniref:D-inositol 3-phosphate glycosyltransferase n=1 Tax=Streptomyces zingiberis TaxID=2053010 RepID=A0ABX1BVX4_9ACTN|nr:glycosyltransferase family 4 protein [Streptomyces zingiberis]NJQ01862.1 glycosyltransferase [Streptomyces zingiberis]
MRFLVVTGTRPWAATGGARRIRAASEALSRLGTVDLVVFRFQGAPPLESDPPVGPFRKVLLLDDAYDNDRNRAALREALPRWNGGEPYDVIWHDRERLWHIAGGLAEGKSVVDVDDLEDVILARWQRLGKNSEGNPLDASEREAQQAEISRLRAGHADVAAAADMLVFTSELDSATFAFPNSTVVPNTYRREEGTAQEHQGPAPGEGGTILFQGWHEWPPNVDAAVWFVEEILPSIRERCPQAGLLLVGKPSPAVRKLGSAPGVEVVGEVPHMRPYLDRADVMIAPLRVGGGTRIKILEGFASGVPVVSTGIGCEGLGAEDGVHLRIADDAEAFARSVADLLVDGDLRRALATNAGVLYEKQYTPHAANEAIRRIVEQLTA